MSFETFFRLLSYAAVFCGFLALWVSGTTGIALTLGFCSIVFTAWMIEGSRWQISERLGTTLIVLALPAFYLAWRYQLISFSGQETAVAGVLARMILSLTAVKLLQNKSDRDWIFLYLMSFFEVLLAAGLSISAMYLASFVLYLLLMVSAIIAFEIRKTAKSTERKIQGGEKGRDPMSYASPGMRVRRLPVTATVLIITIIAFALPLFFILPRVGGAGFGGSQSGLSTTAGFSDLVRLGGFGRINQTDEVVMRVKVEERTSPDGELYLRGAALDTFDNQSWTRSKTGPKEPFVRGESDLIQIDLAAGRDDLSVQTVYLEPLDTPIIFALSRPVAVAGNFPVIYRDGYGSLSYQRSYERVSYRVISDRSQPSVQALRSDRQAYSSDVQNYRSLPPVIDPRIAGLTTEITSAFGTRYDKAKAVETYLQNNFTYSLEQKPSGPQPLADFLFNVREGHCEYFATAMAIMLRTQGIATRVVNGFYGGEYNDAAGLTVIRQRNAHAWVEVYFPQTNSWIRFDPTPAGAQGGGANTPGIAATFNKYLEALESMWIQYFVAYDDQGQRSLARTVRDGISGYQAGLSEYTTAIREMAAEWWANINGERGVETRLSAVAYALGVAAAAVAFLIFLAWAWRRLGAAKFWSSIGRTVASSHRSTIVEFYERMQRMFAEHGLLRPPHLTPLEFAGDTGVPGAISITQRYNRVRFGGRDLDERERIEVEAELARMAEHLADTRKKAADR